MSFFLQPEPTLRGRARKVLTPGAGTSVRGKRKGMSVEDMRELAKSISTGSDSQELDFGMDDDDEGGQEEEELSDSPSHESDAPGNVESENPTPSTSTGKGRNKGKGKGKRTLTQLEKVLLMMLTRCILELNSMSFQRVAEAANPEEGLSYNAAMSKLDDQNRIMLDQVARFFISIGQKQRELKDDIRKQQTSLDVILKQLRDHDGLIKVSNKYVVTRYKLDNNYISDVTRQRSRWREH